MSRDWISLLFNLTRPPGLLVVPNGESEHTTLATEFVAVEGGEADEYPVAVFGQQHPYHASVVGMR